MSVRRATPEEVHRIPRLPGTYALLFHLRRAVTITVGALGVLHLKPGFYVYVGSARGSGGLAARIGRHLRPEKRAHWHIDHLTRQIRPVAVFYTTEPQIRECHWVQRLLEAPGTTVPLPGMGSSDCQAGCPAHFLRVDTPTAAVLARYLEEEKT